MDRGRGGRGRSTVWGHHTVLLAMALMATPRLEDENREDDCVRLYGITVVLQWHYRKISKMALCKKIRTTVAS